MFKAVGIMILDFFVCSRLELSQWSVYVQYHIVGIFRGGKYSFFSNKSDFRAFCFCFISAILHYSRPHPFCEISFFGLILEWKKTKITPHENYPLYGIIHPYFRGVLIERYIPHAHCMTWQERVWHNLCD